ncbi:MAG: hypothetical protein ACYCX2_06145 [Christensenellales bacterium]
MKSKKCLPVSEIALKAGSIVNGVIINQDEVIQQLKNNRKLMKNDILLIIDSSNIQVKLIDMPKLGKLQKIAVMRNEFSMGTDNQDTLYASVVIGESNKNDSMLCYAVQSELINSYIEVFAAAKIKIRKIDIAINCIVNYVRQIPQLSSKTFIMNIISGQNMLSLLFEKGKYIITSRNRLLSDADSDEYLRELYSKVLSMMQFNESQKSLNKIETSYYFGLDADTISRFAAYFAGLNSEIKVMKLNYGLCEMKREYQNVFYPQLGFYADENTDLLETLAYFKKMNRKKNRKPKRKLIFAMIICMVIAAAGALLYHEKNTLNEESAALSAYLNDAENMKRHEEIQQTAAQNNLLAEKVKQVRAVKEIVQNNRIISSSKYIRICIQTDVQIEAFDYALENRTLKISGLADDALRADEYIAYLRRTDLFEKIDYEGYYEQSEDEQSKYFFSLECIMKTGEQK